MEPYSILPFKVGKRKSEVGKVRQADGHIRFVRIESEGVTRQKRPEILHVESAGHGGRRSGQLRGWGVRNFEEQSRDHLGNW